MKILLSSFVSILVLCAPAFANVIGADTQNFNPDYGHHDFVTVRSSRTLPKANLNLTLFADYSGETLPVYPENPTERVEGNLGDTAIYTNVGIGLGITDWLDVGFSVPALMYQNIDPSSLSRGQFEENGEGMVEIRVGAKVRLSEFKGGGGTALQTSVGLNQIENNPFIGKDPGPTVNFEFIVDKYFGELHLSGNIGYRMRTPGEPLKRIGGLDIIPNDDILIASIGASTPVAEKLSLIGELWAALPDDGKYGGVAIDRDKNIYEGLVGLKYKYGEKLNFHGGFTRGINKGLATPTYRFYGGMNWMFGPLWKAKEEKVKSANLLDAETSFYDPGFRQGYMAGYGIGPYAGLGADHGASLDGGQDYAEGFKHGYIAAGYPFPEKVVAKTPYSKCYRVGFQGKVGNGPAEGQGLGFGPVLGLGVECDDGYDQGWTDAPDREIEQESFYNPGYREGYKAGYGIGPYAGLGADYGKTLDGGWEFPEGFRDGYNDATGPFPGSDETRVYGQAYRQGFQGKLGVGPGANTGISFGASINPQDPFPLGWEHGWIDAPNIAPEPITLDARDANAFDDLEAQKEESFRLENVLFDFDSYRLRRESMAVLDSLARHLQKGTGFRRLIIEGHTDSDGEKAYNERLSLQRALSVEKYLTDVHGFDTDKIIADGWGERRPVVPNDSAANKQKNRRVEFKITRD